MKKDVRNHPLKTLIKILTYLSEHRFGGTLEDLVEETGMSRRSVYRYITVIKESGIGISCPGPRGPGRPGRYRLVRRERYARLLGLDS